MSSSSPPPTPDQVLTACATGTPLPAILSLLAACPTPPTAQELASAAVEHDRADVVAHLLAAGTPTHRIDRRLAVAKRSLPVLEALLAAGWDVNEDLGGYRGGALASAVLGRAPAGFVAWLLERGADPNGPYGGVDHLGHALRLAVQMADEGEEAPTAVARMLLERGAEVDGSRALHMAAQQGRLGWVRCLVEEWGGDVNGEWFDPDWAGSTEVKNGIGLPLHYAARNGDPEVVRYLVDKGADLRRKDTNGRTPREVAEHFGNDEAARILRLALEGESK